MSRLPFLLVRVETEPITPSPQIRQPCPPGSCDCGHEQLPETAGSDLEKLQQRMYEQLGIRLAVAPGFNEVRSMRGIAIQIDEQPGLCRKTRQALPTAIRRGLEKHPEIAYRLLDAHDLFREV